MMTENNFFTHIQKWSVCKADTREPPKFFRQSFDLADKTIIPYDELTSWKNDVHLENLIPHFFIEDYKQTCFADNPKKHSDILDYCYAVFSPDYIQIVQKNLIKKQLAKELQLKLLLLLIQVIQQDKL